MPEIVVAKPFSITLASNDVRRFEPGIHTVDPEIADHWYAKDFLSPDGKLPEPAQTAPLTHEERIAMKATLDAAEGRAKAAETEAKTARDERDGLKGAMDKLVAENASLKSRAAALEADLDKATKLAVPAPSVARPK